MNTVQPYTEADQWTFRRRRRSSHENTEQLALYWEPDGSAMSDDYLPDDADAAELWRLWATRYGNKYHQEYPDAFSPWQVPIYWFVHTFNGRGTFEAAPHQTLPKKYQLPGDFLTHYTAPVHAATGEPLNWLRLPVTDHGWNAKQADKGGFIQEAAGWKPSPLQPVMDVRQVARAAGVYVP